MYGFPDELYKIKYKAKGAPKLAHITKSLIKEDVKTDNSRGIDHGVWSVLCRMYPEADILVYQLSVDRSAGARTHFEIGNEIKGLREKGVLILGSGNVVHNLYRLNFEINGGYPWALDFDSYIRDKILKRQYEVVIDNKSAGESSRIAFLTPEHFYPLLYVLGVLDEKDKVTVFNNKCMGGSLSQACFTINKKNVVSPPLPNID